MSKLNQVLAIEKRTKQLANKRLTVLHRQSRAQAMFSGFSKIYEPKEEDAETFPPESQIVQKKVPDSLKELRLILSDLFDVTLTKDSANQEAKANIVVDDITIVSDVPATTLLFLEKQLIDINTYVNDLPTLDPAYVWNMDEGSGLFKTAALKTHKTRKVQRAIVLYDATPEHPAQTQLISEDVIIGHWNTVRQSGAIPEAQKRQIVERVEKLIKAVKFAREKANTQEAPNRSLGTEVFNYLLS